MSHDHEDDIPNPTLWAAEARALLPALSYAEFHEYAATQRPAHSAEENDITYTHYLVARGIFDDLVSFLDRFDPEYRGALVNRVTYDTYWGNSLNTCLYWNTGTGALNIYRYLVTAGAVPTRDHYEQYPWEAEGQVYICPLRGRNIREGFDRDQAEFESTYADIQRYFPLPDAAADAEAVQEPLGGAGVESDLVQHAGTNLLNAWQRPYSDEAIATARLFGTDLANLVLHRRHNRRIVTAPDIDTLLDIHSALLGLQEALRSRSSDFEIAGILHSLDALAESAGLPIASYPLYAVAMEHLHAPIEPLSD
jgi:hypothetical protein